MTTRFPTDVGPRWGPDPNAMIQFIGRRPLPSIARLPCWFDPHLSHGAKECDNRANVPDVGEKAAGTNRFTGLILR
jgi:hypothetical protein